MVSKLSGGERRRLSVAHELISQPDILLLDKPTTGLDSASGKQLIHVLRGLTRGDSENGRKMAIPCPIHQPSSGMLLMFDRLYALSLTGQCIYRGSLAKIYQRLESMGHNVLETRTNPAEHLMEQAMNPDLKPMLPMIDDDDEDLKASGHEKARGNQRKYSLTSLSTFIGDMLDTDKRSKFSDWRHGIVSTIHPSPVERSSFAGGPNPVASFISLIHPQPIQWTNWTGEFVHVSGHERSNGNNDQGRWGLAANGGESGRV